MSDEIKELKARLDRLEAKEACLSKFNEYLYYTDGEKYDDLFTVLAPDAVVELIFPEAEEIMTLEGHEQIRPVYERQAGIIHRHHTMNLTVNVSPDSKSAELSAYLFTVLKHILTGGIYEATLQNIDGQWYITRLRISSTWGWAVPSDLDPILDAAFGAGTKRDGRPVLY